jgi:hypothetical protein
VTSVLNSHGYLVRALQRGEATSLMRLIARSVLFFFVILNALGAQETAPPDIVVALFGAGGRSPFHNVIARSLVLELTRNGFKAEPAAGAGEFVPAGGTAGIAGLADAASAPLALFAVYSFSGNEITVRLDGIEAKGARILSSTQKSARIDLALDETLFSAVREVIAPLAPIRDRARAQRPQPAAGAGAGPVAGGAPAADAAAAPAPTAAGTPATAAGAGPAAPQAPPSRFAPLPPQGLELGLGAAPLVPAGDLAVFLGTGASLAAHVEMQWRHPSYQVGLGVGMGALYFGAEGPLSSATGLLAPLTLEARYGAGQGDTGFYARAGAGAALFVVNSDIVGTLSKFVPCATAAIGLTRRVNDKVGVALDATYGVYLDSSDLIMGLAPGLQVFFVR